MTWPHMSCSAQRRMAAPVGRPAELRVPSDMPMHLSSVLIRALEKGPGQRLSSHARTLTCSPHMSHSTLCTCMALIARPPFRHGAGTRHPRGACSAPRSAALGALPHGPAPASALALPEVIRSIPQALPPPLGGRVHPAGQHTLNCLHDRANPYRRGAGRRLQQPPPDPIALYHPFRAPCHCCTCAHSCASHAQCVHAHAHCLVGRALRAPRLCCMGAHSCASHAQCVHAHAHVHCLVGSALRALCAFAARVLINVHAHAQWLRACTCTCTLPR
jgi:hypothetical protein